MRGPAGMWVEWVGEGEGSSGLWLLERSSRSGYERVSCGANHRCAARGLVGRALDDKAIAEAKCAEAEAQVAALKAQLDEYVVEGASSDKGSVQCPVCAPRLGSSEQWGAHFDVSHVLLFLSKRSCGVPLVRKCRATTGRLLCAVCVTAGGPEREASLRSMVAATVAMNSLLQNRIGVRNTEVGRLVYPHWHP